MTGCLRSSAEQEKYEAALQHSDAIKVVTPDWFTDTIKSRRRLEENVYDPKFILPPRRETPPRPDPLLLPDLHMLVSGKGVRVCFIFLSF